MVEIIVDVMAEVQGEFCVDMWGNNCRRIGEGYDVKVSIIPPKVYKNVMYMF